MENAIFDQQQQQSLPQQLPPQKSPPSQQSPQAGFAPRRQYESQSLIDASDPVDAEVLSNGGTVQLPYVPSVTAKGEMLPGLPKPKEERMRELTAALYKLSLVDTLKLTDGNGIVMKTPVSVLQEILCCRGIAPSYEVVQIEGAKHQPTFRYRVSFNDKGVPFTAMGAGHSKKEAKHSAANALIEKLTGVKLPDTQSDTGSTTVPLDGNLNATGCGDGANNVTEGNPIGLLQGMCMSRRWPQPTYETETEDGLPHERLYTIACTIHSFREVGKAKNKKIAKRLAAHKMCARLQENPLDNNQNSESIQAECDSDDSDIGNRNSANYFDDLKDITVPTLTSQHSNKVAHSHKTLKSAAGKKLLKLQKTCLRAPNLDYIKMLSEIANKNQFEVTYVDIEEKTYRDQYQCLVQLSTLPVGVCHGSGETSVDAQEQAAQNALEYLKIMTKK